MSVNKDITHNFKVQDANRYGVEKAVVLSALRYFIENNIKNKDIIYYHKDYYWFTISAKDLSYILPYYTQSKVQRLLKQLEIEKAVITGNFNYNSYDRTK